MTKEFYYNDLVYSINISMVVYIFKLVFFANPVTSYILLAKFYN